MRFTIILIFALTFFALACSPVIADGIDLVWYFTRTGNDQQSMISIFGTIALLMLANYALNFVVIGLPAIKVGAVRVRLIATGLVWLTLLGQLADRVGALIAALLSDPLAAMLGLDGMESWILLLLVLNFLFSGIAIGVLAFYFLRRRWHIGRGISWAIACVAAIVTNPAWAIFSRALWVDR